MPTRSHDDIDPLDENPPPQHLDHLSETLLLWLLEQCDGDWRRVTLDDNDVPTVHNKPQPPPLVRVELPPEGETAKRMGVRSRRVSSNRSSRTSAASAPVSTRSSRTSAAPVSTTTWDNKDWTWNPVVRDPATRNLGKLVVKVDQGEEIEPDEQAAEQTPSPPFGSATPRRLPAPPVFTAPPTPPTVTTPPTPMPAPPKPTPTPVGPPVQQAFPSLDEARTSSARALGGNSSTSPPMRAGTSGAGGNGSARTHRPPITGATPARAPEDETLRRPRVLRQRLLELGAEVIEAGDGARAVVKYRGYDIGTFKLKGATPGSLRNSWAELSAKIERMR